MRAIDLALQDLFIESKQHIFPGNPLEHLDEYQHFTEWSLLIEVAGWHRSNRAGDCGSLGERWQQFLRRQLPWKMAVERTIFFAPGEAEQSSVFSSEKSLETAVREHLPAELRDLPIRVDTARHVHRPGAMTPTAGQNFLYDPADGQIRSLDDRELFRRIAISYPHLPHLRGRPSPQRRVGGRHGPDRRRPRRG